MSPLHLRLVVFMYCQRDSIGLTVIKITNHSFQGVHT